MKPVNEQIETLKESFQVEDAGPNHVKVYMFASNDLNFELDIDMSPISQGKKPKIGFEKSIKDILGNINNSLSTMSSWNDESEIVNVLYELEDKLMEATTAKFTVMDEIYVLVGNYGPRATFEGKIAKVKLIDLRKNEYLVTIDAGEYPKLKVTFPEKLSEKIGDPDDLRFVEKWAGHLFELVGELEYRLDLYERINFESQVLLKFSEFVNKESMSFNPATGYISGDLENGNERLELDLDYMNGYPDVMPRAIVNIRPDNPAKQSKINEIIEDATEKWAVNHIFMMTLDKIVQAVWGKRLSRDLKQNKPIAGDLYKCPECGNEYLKSSKDKDADKFRCDTCFFGNVKRKTEKLIDDLLGKFAGDGGAGGGAAPGPMPDLDDDSI
nr:hypothetical protein [Candidatus Sigynarchaeota archaeon]